MWAPEGADGDVGGPGVSSAYGRVFDSTHDLQPMAQDVIVKPETDCLVAVAGLHADKAFVTALGLEAILAVAARELVAAHDLEFVG